MLRNKAWGLAGLLLISACNSPENNGSSLPMSVEQEKATESFEKSLSHAFSKEAVDEILKSSGEGAGSAEDFGRSMIAIVCGIADKPGSALLMSDMSAEEREVCSIWGMAARTLGKDDQSAVVGADVDGDISIEPLWQGQVKSKGRVLPAILLEAKLNIVNRLDGFRGQVCIRKFSVVDSEFDLERSIMFRSCASADRATIGEAMTQAGVINIPEEYGSAPEKEAANSSIDNSTVPDPDNASSYDDGSTQVQTPAQIQSTHEQAVADNKLSTQGIMAAWNAIDTSTRADILPQQRAWIKSKDANCSVEAASASLDQTERETARLKCDTKANRSRVEWLKQYLPQ